MLPVLKFASATLLMVALLLVSFYDVDLHAVVEEVESLLNWKSTLVNQSGSLLHSWKKSSTGSVLISPCRWYGITCNDKGSITKLNITGLLLQGTLHSFNFSSFSKLVSFNLNSNKLFGSIPPQIANLSKLTYLDLSKNELSGHIPPEIGFLTSMSLLDISQNQISGSIPNFIRNLSNLDTLYLYENQLSGTIPQGIGILKSLVNLGFSANNLVGIIPISLCNLSNLDTLYLHENHLSGTIPQEIGSLRSITNISLYRNKLTGSIPISLCNSTNLSELLLFQNRLSGTIPQDIGKLRNLNVLQLSRNNLSGPIPTSVCNLSNMFLFFAYENQLSGSIPQEIGRLKSLTDFVLHYNNLVGPIPNSICSLSKLNRLILVGNQLSGTIPQELGRLRSLLDLRLYANNLVGSIPTSLCNSTIGTSLQYLDLSDNKLTGPIPKQLGECSKLFFLNLSRNSFNESIPSQIGTLSSLSLLLDLSQNELTGKIPSDLGNLNKLESLNLSHNKLSGLIPPSFDELVSLTTVDISYNELSGPIPNIKAFMDAPFDALKNNSGLCGNHSGGFAPCNSLVTNTRKVAKAKLVMKVLVPLFGSLFLLLGKNGKQVDQTKAKDTRKNLFSIWNFDGKLVFEDIIEATEDFDAKYCIGTGGYGTVYKVELPTSQVVAVKKLHSSDEDSEIFDLKSFESEVHAYLATMFCWMLSTKLEFLILLAYTMKVTEKCDVYSFGIVLLEVLMGRHPSEIIMLLSPILVQSSCSSPTSSTVGQNMRLQDILDPCIGAPTDVTKTEIMNFMKVGFSCIRGDPCTRPTMQEVSVELSVSARSRPSFGKPFETITLGDILLMGDS
ncbi:hypothetical protein MKW92_007323 [Papaver armeniacum]|nr:hypothetical protein MKW92_007323 [Papaver armeniacum]